MCCIHPWLSVPVFAKLRSAIDANILCASTRSVRQVQQAAHFREAVNRTHNKPRPCSTTIRQASLSHALQLTPAVLTLLSVAPDHRG